MEEKKTRTTKKIDLLTSVEKIVDLANESKLNKEFYRKADKYIKYISEKLELTKEESVMIALFINWSDDYWLQPQRACIVLRTEDIVGIVDNI